VELRHVAELPDAAAYVRSHAAMERLPTETALVERTRALKNALSPTVSPTVSKE